MNASTRQSTATAEPPSPIRGNPGGADGQQSANAGETETEAENAAGDGEQGAFNEQLTNDAPAAGAESAADGEFPLPRSGARKQKICDIRAGDEQHQADGAKEDHKGIAYVSDDAVAERLNLEANSWTGLLWIIAMVLSGSKLQLRVCLLKGDAGLEKAGDMKEVIHVAADRRKLERQPDIRFGVADKLFSDDADDRIRLIAH